MSKNNSFYVHAMWDPEISRWFTHSDISGAHFETDTLQEFIDAMEEFVPDLVASNHGVSDPDDCEVEFKAFAEVDIAERLGSES